MRRDFGRGEFAHLPAELNLLGGVFELHNSDYGLCNQLAIEVNGLNFDGVWVHEYNDVSPFSRRQTSHAAVQMNEARGVGGDRLQGIAQRSVVQSGSGWPERSSCAAPIPQVWWRRRDDAVIGRKINFQFAQAVAAGCGSSGRSGVGDQDGSLHAFCPRRYAQERIVQMNSIGNEAGAQAIFRKLVREEVGELRKQLVRGISEMRGERCAGVDCGCDLFRDSLRYGRCLWQRRLWRALRCNRAPPANAERA